MRDNLGTAATDLFGWSPPTVPDEPRYPNAPGWREPTTSREAAEKIAGSANVIRQRVFAVINDSPEGLGVHEIAKRLLLSVAAVQPRVSELKRAGRVVASGKRCKNESGASAHCWRAVPLTQQASQS